MEFLTPTILATEAESRGLRPSLTNDVKHADDEFEPTTHILNDEEGYVVGFVVGQGVVVHYGVKGMKWGVTTRDGAPKVTQTKEKTSLRSAKDVTVSQRKAGKYVTTKGGQRQKATEDAVKAQAGRQKAKKSTTDALTNKELKDTIERMRLEQEYKKLNSKVSRRGENFVSKLLRTPEMKQTAADLAKRVAVANA